MTSESISYEIPYEISYEITSEVSLSSFRSFQCSLYLTFSDKAISGNRDNTAIYI